VGKGVGVSLKCVENCPKSSSAIKTFGVYCLYCCCCGCCQLIVFQVFLWPSLMDGVKWGGEELGRCTLSEWHSPWHFHITKNVCYMCVHVGGRFLSTYSTRPIGILLKGAWVDIHEWIYRQHNIWVYPRRLYELKAEILPKEM